MRKQTTLASTPYDMNMNKTSKYMLHKMNIRTEKKIMSEPHSIKKKKVGREEMEGRSKKRRCQCMYKSK